MECLGTIIERFHTCGALQTLASHDGLKIGFFVAVLVLFILVRLLLEHVVPDWLWGPGGFIYDSNTALYGDGRSPWAECFSDSDGGTGDGGSWGNGGDGGGCGGD